MSTITKEWLQQKIADMEATRDDIPFGLDEDDSNTLAALRIALASLEAEAVGFIARHKETGKFGSYLHPKADWFKNDEYEVLSAYITPPAPVSDEDLLQMAASAIDDLLSNKARSGAGVWADIPAKLRRAAMLQGADGNSPVISDGWVMVPVDMAPEMMRAVQVNSELGAYAAANLTGAYSLFREFWDVAVTAAPQQEVKS